MASNNIDDEKPNLRPTKLLDASGKTLGLRQHSKQLCGDSYIYATWNNPSKTISLDRPGLFGIEQPLVPLSLNKQQRWKLFDDFRRNIAHSSDLSSDDELQRQSPSNLRRKTHSTTTTEFRQNEQNTNYVEIMSNAGERCTKVQRKPLTKKRIDRTTKSERIAEDRQTSGQNHEPKAEKAAADITYVAVISSRKKQSATIRKHHGKKPKKFSFNPQYTKFSPMEEHSDDDTEELSTDNEEFVDSQSTSSNLNPLQLNDFLSLDTTPSSSVPLANSTVIDKFDPKSSRIYLDEMISSPHQKNLFTRQISRDMTKHLKRQPDHRETVQSKTKSSHHLMSLSFRSITFDKTELTREYLSKTYGKQFIDAQCYPTKYLICLTDRLKSSSWADKSDFFRIYSTLNCYLILILNEETEIEENICHGQVAVNIDLYAETIVLDNLSSSQGIIYRIEELIEKTIDLLTALPFETFKPIDSEISQRKLIKIRTDHELSDSEFLNKQIQHVQLLNTNDLQMKLTMKGQDESTTSVCSRPEICNNCYQDTNDLTPMTALKTCAHWLCNDCWKKYLENSIKCVKLVVCPEWNCSSVVDAGTILSLVNVRCLNIYERHIEKCLVNLSRSYVRCALTSCSNIIQIIGSSAVDYVRCRCGHQFCRDCKEEPHFPAACRSYRAYIDEATRNGDLNSDFNAKTVILGRKCISCCNFIEKNGGCDHMTCRCGAEFCWICASYWKDHRTTAGEWKCPRGAIDLQKRTFRKDRNVSRQLYSDAIYHRHQRTFQVQTKLKENAKRLVGTIPLEKETLIETQIDKRQALLDHCYQMVKYLDYLHRICEFIAVAAEGYGDHPREFLNSFYPFESIIFNVIQIFDSGRGYTAIEQLNELYQRSEKHTERLRRAVRLRRLHQENIIGYVTS